MTIATLIFAFAGLVWLARIYVQDRNRRRKMTSVERDAEDEQASRDGFF